MTAVTSESYRPILDLMQQISKAQDAGAHVAALAMVYVAIDTFAWLSLPKGEERQTKVHFCKWVDTYLKTDASQAYQYAGMDLYAARCSVLHMFATLSDLHKKDQTIKKFGYVDNGPHRNDGGELVLISIAVLIRDLGSGVSQFLKAIQADQSLRANVESRITKLLETMTIQYSE